MKYIKYLIPIFIFFIGLSVSAKGTMFIGNGVVLNQCTGNNCAYPSGGTTNLRFILDPMSFNVDSQYTFKLNFNATTSLASPTLSDCGLNINGAYVSPESRNSGRISYECNADYSSCFSTYASTIIWTSTSSLSSVPVFIQCDMTPSSTRYNLTHFTAATTDSQGSVITAFNENTDRMIETNNYNANQNNANRDRNTNKLTDKIQDFMDSVSSGIGNIISNLTTLGSNIVSGISNAINSGVTTISNGLNAIVTSIGNGVSSVVNKLGDVISAINNKIGELIGLNEVCTIYYKTINNEVVFGNSGVSNKALDSNGNLVNNSNFNTSDFILIPANSGDVIMSNNYGWNGNYCIYRSFDGSSLVNCSTIPNNTTAVIFNNSSSSYNRYIRFSYYNSGNSTYILEGDCHKSGILGIFNNFNQFVKDFFSNVLGLNRIGSVLDRHKGILENPAFDGITSVINAPRQLIQSMNSYSCTNITTSVFNKSITLPSGCFFWEREDVSSFRAFWNLLFGGFLIYKFAYRLFKVLNDCLDPTKDEIGGFEV